MERGIKKYGLILSTALAVIIGLPAFIAAPAVMLTPALAPTPYPLVYPAYFGHRINTADDNPLTKEGVRLGRLLFYEKRLSAANNTSCATCHQQALAFTDGRVFTPGFDGTPTRRNSMSLTNLLWIRHFFWDGRAASLEAQAQIPLTDPHEMGQPLDSSAAKLTAAGFYAPLFAAAFGGGPDSVITPSNIIKALTQFERTLISADAPYDRYIRGEYQLTASERRGLDLFFGPSTSTAVNATRNAGCSNCHGGPRTITETYHNNGLDRDPKDSGRAAITGLAYDLGRFRVVSLRNIALTAPYMHDGRFTTLSEVIDHYSDHIEPSPTLSPSLKDTLNVPARLRLTRQEKADLLAFLQTLTDSTFITDLRFSDPFVKNKIE